MAPQLTFINGLSLRRLIVDCPRQEAFPGPAGTLDQQIAFALGHVGQDVEYLQHPRVLADHVPQTVAVANGLAEGLDH